MIAYDARGHGDSGRAKAYGLQLFAEDALRVARSTGAQQVIFAGHSFGGTTALVATAREPALVRALVLEDPALSRYRQGAVWRRWLVTLKVAIERVQAGGDPVTELAPALPEGVAPAEAARIRALIGQVDPELIAQDLADESRDAPGQAAIAAALPSLTLPVLLLVAAPGSTVVTPDEVRFVERLPRAEVLRFPQSGHQIHLRRPAEVAAAIEDFLARI